MKYVAYYVASINEVDVVTEDEFNEMPASIKEIAQILYKGTNRQKAKQLAGECEIDNGLEHNNRADIEEEKDEVMENFYEEDLEMSDY